MKARDKKQQPKRANWKKQKLCTEMTTLKKLLLIWSKTSEKTVRPWKKKKRMLLLKSSAVDLHILMTVWPWAIYLSFSRLCFFIYKTAMITRATTSWVAVNIKRDNIWKAVRRVPATMYRLVLAVALVEIPFIVTSFIASNRKNVLGSLN